MLNPLLWWAIALAAYWGRKSVREWARLRRWPIWLWWLLTIGIALIYLFAFLGGELP